MTSAIRNEAYVCPAPTDPTVLSSDARKGIAYDEPSAENRTRIAAGQIGHRGLAPSLETRSTIEPLRVLIVEDDLTIGPLLAETLEQLGHVVCALEVDAAAAVDAARRRHPDLMIVDIGLGEASGIAAVEQILKERFVPHVFVTGDSLRGLPLGHEAVLIQKPYRSSDLAAAIARAIEGKAKRDAVQHEAAGVK